jgi:hypothetical protein
MACFPAARVRGNQWSPNGFSHEGDELEGSTCGAAFILHAYPGVRALSEHLWIIRLWYLTSKPALLAN